MSTFTHPYDMVDALLNEIVEYASESTKNYPGASGLRDQLVERIGFDVGRRHTKDRTTRFASELEIIKYVCTEFWSSAFHKQVDTLKTNNQVLNGICILDRLAHGTQYLNEAIKYLSFPVGMLRGALESLGLACSVTADCQFTVKVVRRTSF